MSFLINPEDRGPKCPSCGITAIKLLDVPVKGVIKGMCLTCKRKYRIKHGITEEFIQCVLARIRKQKLPKIHSS